MNNSKDEKMRLSMDLIKNIADNNIEIVRELLLQGAPINTIITEMNLSALHLAVAFGNLEMVKLLVENGADTTNCSENIGTPLDMANEKGYDEIAKFLKDYASSKSDKSANLFLAVLGNDIEEVKRILGGDIRASGVLDINGVLISPVTIAKLIHKNQEMVDLLIECGASEKFINLSDEEEVKVLLALSEILEGFDKISDLDDDLDDDTM